MVHCQDEMFGNPYLAQTLHDQQDRLCTSYTLSSMGPQILSCRTFLVDKHTWNFW